MTTGSFDEKKIVLKVTDTTIMIYDEVAKQRIDVIPRSADNYMDKVFDVIAEIMEE